MATSVNQTLVKRVSESRVYDFDFTLQPELVGGQTLTGPVIAATAGDGQLVIANVVVSGAKVQVRLSAGTAGQTYTLKCTVGTSGGSTLIEDGDLNVIADS